MIAKSKNNFVINNSDLNSNLASSLLQALIIRRIVQITSAKQRRNFYDFNNSIRIAGISLKITQYRNLVELFPNTQDETYRKIFNGYAQKRKQLNRFPRPVVSRLKERKKLIKQLSSEKYFDFFFFF